MKRLIPLILIYFFVKIISAQTVNSVLSSGDWFKFSVDTTGVFKIDKNFLQQLGVATNNLNPKKIHIYGNGGNLLPVLNSDFRYNDLQENAIYIKGENDGSFDSSDFILFYAKGAHDWIVDTEQNTAKHRQNIYSNEAYYFLTVSNTDGKRVQQKSLLTANAISQITTFNEYVFLEKEEINILAAGTQWFFDDDFNIENTQHFKIPFPNAISNDPVSIRIRGVSMSFGSTTMAVKVNGEALYDLNFSSLNPSSLTKASVSERTAVVQNSRDIIDVSITYDNRGNPSAKAFLDFIEVVGKKELIANGNQFSFRSFEQANTVGPVKYKIQDNSTIFQVWDVSNPLEPKNIINEEDNTSYFTFKDNGGVLNEYVVLSQNDYYTPKLLQNGRVVNQNLHALQDINYLVIDIL